MALNHDGHLDRHVQEHYVRIPVLGTTVGGGGCKLWSLLSSFHYSYMQGFSPHANVPDHALEFYLFDLFLIPPYTLHGGPQLCYQSNKL